MVQPSADKSHGRQRPAGGAQPSKPEAPSRQAEHGSAKRDEQRSDWEGMVPKPEQPSDDIAAPGQLPSDLHADDESN
jgi:hypothetical protein